MPGYETATATWHVGADDYQVRGLADRSQYADPDGSASRAGVSPEAWPLFGMVWPAGLALARLASHMPVAGRRILEVGCGLALSALVLKRRGADVTACDHHPLAGEFLAHNAKLNGLGPIRFLLAPWAGPNPDLGRFDLIIGSDLLYERANPALLAAFIALHATPVAQVIVADPGRGRCGVFSAAMVAQGYLATSRPENFRGGVSPPAARGRMMDFDRR